MIDWEEEFKKIILSQPPALDPFRAISSDGIALYGAGSMGRMAIDLLKIISVKPKYFIDKNFKGKLHNISVIDPKQIPEKDLARLTFIVCVVTAPVQPIFNYLIDIGCVDVRHFYDYSEIVLKDKMSNGWFTPNLSDSDKEKIKTVFKSIEHDEYSTAHYLQFLWWRLRRREVIYSEYPVLSKKKYFSAPYFPALNEHEKLLDVGAHHGSVIKDFAEATNGKYDSIWAFEPDESNQKILKQYLPYNVLGRTKIHCEALSDRDESKLFLGGLGYASRLCFNGNKTVHTVKLDSIKEINPTIIKLHIEGYELEVLTGAIETIKKYRPVLMVLADHNADGLYKIAIFLTALNDYKLYFNLHDYCGNSAIFYCIPKERIKNDK
jgi:FkbM family methyltransferase